jgi:hypothetical protein
MIDRITDTVTNFSDFTLGILTTLAVEGIFLIAFLIVASVVVSNDKPRAWPHE